MLLKATLNPSVRLIIAQSQVNYTTPLKKRRQLWNCSNHSPIVHVLINVLVNGKHPTKATRLDNNHYYQHN